MKPADGHPNGLLECEMKLGAGYTEMRLGIYGMKSDTCKTKQAWCTWQTWCLSHESVGIRI